MVGSALCLIWNGDGNFVLLRKSSDERSSGRSMIGTGGVGVFQTTILLKHGRAFSTVTQLLTHGFYLCFQDFDPLLQLLLLTIGLINIHPMTIDPLL
jgi:hypothetical protein